MASAGPRKSRGRLAVDRLTWQGSYSQRQCYECNTPSDCLKKKVVTCQAEEVCQRAHTKTFMPSNKPEPGDEFQALSGPVFHRKCIKETDCKKETKDKLTELRCCNSNFCNN